MKLVFATHNDHKLQEVRAILGDLVDVVSLKDLQDFDEIEENGLTLEENASIKARTVFTRYGLPCFADDTGLEVKALDGAPGVYSARYAGPGHDAKANMAKLLKEMEGIEDRRARFRTVVSLVIDGKEYLFDGEVAGEIMLTPAGVEGFGYDPVFRPEGCTESFAEMSTEKKNGMSHRGRAIQALARHLSQLPRK
ncbi:RdgB/HAM1 family non-canonical purine NTP pyrophosphatase [Porphyromonas cangingivalis]|uniref:dITP/XTP pyrophosphatase n=1 Tax=Porphyromonas cangingivalis TaxID=36874 RepID=A0A1T4L0T4_PORCN|nr:RdgB/HAM1 family non-canonical purine NTP pyrophosphatase [Porphyromonas cangingivalis]SJZ48334.1 XTP/dITP diphosphohydrolase [Porphyromonas cangingivalis]VEJ03981.1 Non-canonical purine NTP pyrophosphatase [Porphyromonas cangingivalis]